MNTTAATGVRIAAFAAALAAAFGAAYGVGKVLDPVVVDERPAVERVERQAH